MRDVKVNVELPQEQTMSAVKDGWASLSATFNQHDHHALLDYASHELRRNQASQTTKCKICDGNARLFDIVDFNKACHQPPYTLGLSAIPVIYRRCDDCEFIFTDFFDRFSSEQWKSYIYNDEYIEIDPHYLDYRPRHTVRQVEALLVGKKSTVIGLDYGGGNGKTTDLLRTRGWTFDCHDPFDRIDLTPERLGRYNFCCAMEVFEHTPDPLRSLQAIVDMAAKGPLMIMIGTLIHDKHVSNETRLAWWYAAPRNGHVSLYSRKSFEIMASKFGLTYVAVSGYPHLLLRHGDERHVRMQLWRGKVLERLVRA